MQRRQVIPEPDLRFEATAWLRRTVDVLDYRAESNLLLAVTEYEYQAAVPLLDRSLQTTFLGRQQLNLSEDPMPRHAATPPARG